MWGNDTAFICAYSLPSSPPSARQFVQVQIHFGIGKADPVNRSFNQSCGASQPASELSSCNNPCQSSSIANNSFAALLRDAGEKKFRRNGSQLEKSEPINHRLSISQVRGAINIYTLHPVHLEYLTAMEYCGTLNPL